jgi:hypothetical protein
VGNYTGGKKMKKIISLSIMLLMVILSLNGVTGNSKDEEKKEDSALYETYTGHYKGDGGGVFTVKRVGNRLFIETLSRTGMEIFSESKTHFFNKARNVSISFAEEIDGKAARLVMRSGDREEAARRISPKVAIFSGIRMVFNISEVEAGPFDSREASLEKYGSLLPRDLEIISPSPWGFREMWVVVKSEPLFTAKDLAGVEHSMNRHGNHVVSFILKPEAVERMKNYTTANIGKRLAIILDDRVLSAPAVAAPILKGKMFMIGNFTEKEVERVVSLLKVSINEK